MIISQKIQVQCEDNESEGRTKWRPDIECSTPGSIHNVHEQEISEDD